MKTTMTYILMFVSLSAWAEKAARTTNPVRYAEKAALNYGREQSDWGQAKVDGCSQKITENRLSILCSGMTRILGPGGGGDFIANYQCQFLFSKESSRTYTVTNRICE